MALAARHMPMQIASDARLRLDWFCACCARVQSLAQAYTLEYRDAAKKQHLQPGSGASSGGASSGGASSGAPRAAGDFERSAALSFPWAVAGDVLNNLKALKVLQEGGHNACPAVIVRS